MESLKISTSFYPKNNKIVIVQLGGYIDQSNSGQVEKVISDILKSGKQRIVFDFGDLIYMSSAGWGIFVGEIKTVREHGGDIKIAGMSPEIYEVFQMLEFFHIIEDYATITDAIESFPDETPITEVKIKNNKDNYSNNKILVKSQVLSNIIDENQEETIVINDVDENRNIKEQKIFTVEEKMKHDYERQYTEKFHATGDEPKINFAKLPLTEKIKKVVATYPLLSIFQIQKMLGHEKFGFTKINLFQLYRTLKILNLDSKVKRYRYYRST